MAENETEQLVVADFQEKLNERDLYLISRRPELMSVVAKELIVRIKNTFGIQEE